MEEDIDLSSFPLLRIDQIPRHETGTLVDAEAQLTALEHDQAMESAGLRPFVSKLLHCIRKEMATRIACDDIGPEEHGQGDVSKGVLAPDPPTRDKTLSKKAPAKQVPSSKTCTSPSATPPRRRKQRQHTNQPTAVPSPSQPSFFVTSSPSKPSNFRSRAKLAKASLRARSDEAVSRQREERRHERTRQALGTMQEWRLEREKSKTRREELLREERERRRQRRKERREREEQVRSSMCAAAEEAKAMALESGCTQEEAIVEAAAAAARVVDDQSTGFESACADTDEGSIADEETVEEGSISEDVNVFDGVEMDIPPPNEVETGDCPSAHEPDSCERRNSPGHAFAADATSRESTSDCSEDSPPPGVPSDLPLNSLDDYTRKTCEITEGSVSVNSGEKIADGLSESSNSVNIDDDPARSKSNSEYMSGPASPRATMLLSEVKTSTADLQKEPQPLRETTQKVRHVHLPEENVTETDTRPIHPSEFIPLAQNNTSSNETTGKNILQEKAKPRKSNADLHGKFSASFPSFSDIFAQPTNEAARKSPSDIRQRELSKSMQHQISLYARMNTAMASSNSELEDLSDDDSSTTSDNLQWTQGLYFRIASRRPEVTSIIRNSFSDHTVLSAWNELPLDIECSCWNLLWVWGLPKASDFENLLVFQKINRFRGTRSLTRKDLLKKNIQRCIKVEEDSIMPLTYALPHEFNSFVSGYQSISRLANKQANIWIIKPIGLSRGRGISLVDDIADVSYSQPIVIQRYVADPLCFMGFKFDLRVYVLVTSFSPLEAFIYKEGLGRFGSRQYSLRSESLNDHRIHLTNSSIQREFGGDIDRSHPAYLAGSNGSGNKVSMQWLFGRLEGLGLNAEALWQQIIVVCRKALIASGSEIPHQPNSFEIFGFDIMFDSNLKCWLLEVNSSPSLGCDSPLDTRIKGGLIRDSIALVDPQAYDRRILADVCKRRLTRRKSASDCSRNVLERDLSDILKGKPPRPFGKVPRRLGLFRQIV